MRVTRRRLIVGATTTLAVGTVAVPVVWRKPEATAASPQIFTLAAGEAADLKQAGAIVPRNPPAPPGEAQFFDGEGEARRITDFVGQGLVLNLWATWCVPCVVEMPALQAMARALAADKIAVLPLSSDRGGAAVVRRFFASHDIQGLGVWLDPKGEAARAWGARGLPTTLIVDRKGREVARVEGPIEWASAATIAEVRRLVG